jgi:molybdopterin-binding protein
MSPGAGAGRRAPCGRLPLPGPGYPDPVVDYLRIGEVAQRVGVSVDTLRRWEGEGRISFERRGNQRVLPATQLAGVLNSLAGADRTSSARNRLTGVVVSVERDGVMAKVELACGDYRVVSLMSREAADEMELAPGVPATAIVKSTSVMVEVESATGPSSS